MYCFTEQKDHQCSDKDLTTRLHCPPLNHQNCGQKWQYIGSELVAKRSASVAGNIATDSGTPSTHPLMVEQFFGNATCSVIYGRHYSATNNNISSIKYYTYLNYYYFYNAIINFFLFFISTCHHPTVIKQKKLSTYNISYQLLPIAM